MHRKAATLVLSAASWAWPVAGDIVRPFDFGSDPFAAGQHRGIDIRAEPGTPVHAVTAGRVRFTGRLGASGLVVSVRSADGRFDTSYLHLASVAVREGDAVATGSRLGSAGITGRPSSRTPHLHLGVRRAGERDAYVDPLGLLPPRAGPQPRLGPPPRPVPVAAPRFERPAPPRPSLQPVDLGWAVACLALIALVALLGRSSIGAPCRTTSPRLSTTSMASRTSATSTRQSPPTSSPATCASAATTSSS